MKLVLRYWIIILTSCLFACSSQVALVSSVPEGEANEILAVLLNAGISASKTPGREGVGVMVASAHVADAIDLLRDKGLPREIFQGMGDIFKKDGLISSPLEERGRYLYALSQELSATISKIDGVLVSRVHVVLPERGDIGDARIPSSAAVFIKYSEGYSLDAVLPQIRRLVTNSIPDLTQDKVSVVLVKAQKPLVEQIKTLDTVFGLDVSQLSAGRLKWLVGSLMALALAALIVAALLVVKVVMHSKLSVNSDDVKSPKKEA